MAAGRFSIRRAAITECVDMKPVFSRIQSLQIGFNFDTHATLVKGDGSVDIVSPGRVHNGNRFGNPVTALRK